MSLSGFLSVLRSVFVFLGLYAFVKVAYYAFLQKPLWWILGGLVWSAVALTIGWLLDRAVYSQEINETAKVFDTDKQHVKKLLKRKKKNWYEIL